MNSRHFCWVNSMKDRKKPAIRFKGFTEDWEQRKVTELGKIYIGLVTTMTAHYTDEGTILIRNSDIKDGKFEFGEKPIFLEKSFAMANESRMHQIGDVITVHTGDVGTSAVISENEDKSIGFATIVTRPNKTIIDPSYLCTFLNTERHKKWAVAISTGDGRTNYNLGDYFELVVPVPSIKEQKQIAMFIEKLNNLITLHQRKYDKLVNVKKSMLEKMFPCDGKIVPDIRFSGFTEDWEQRKLNKISDKVTEKNIGLQYIETFTNSAEFGIISQRDFFDHEIANMSSLGGYYIVRSEDFVYNPRISATAPVGPINRNKLGRVGVMSPLYTVFRTYDVDTTYLEHFFKSRYWHSFMNFNGDSGARSDRFSIKDAIFFEMNIPIPHIEEQMKIGEYLTHINNLITLHQRKLEKLKNIKKSCLEKMFI